MSYSIAFKNMTKYQLECKLREINSLHKTEIKQLENDNNHLKGAVTSLSERLEVVTKERDAKEESNKKLADQFYAYRKKLISTSHELEGVRGALKHESEMRVEAKKKCDELCENLVKMGNEFEAYRKSFNDKDIECDKLRDKAWKWDKIHELVNAHGIDTMSKLKDALVELEHKREDVESLKTSLADSCAAKIKEGRDLTAKIESLERELCSAQEAMARDAEEAHKLRGWYDDLKKLYDKARKEGEEGCAMWREDAWKAKDDRDFYKKKSEDLEHVADDQAKQIKALVNKRDELQDRVNVLEQRWTDKFNPGDEMLGRKVLEWQDINVLLAKHNIENSMVLGAELDMLKEYRKVLDKHGITGQTHLDESLEKLERFQQMLREWHFRTIDEFRTYISGLYNYEFVCRQNLIGSTDELKKSLDELKAFRLSKKDDMLGRKISEWQEYDAVLVKYGISSPESLDAKLDPFEPARLAAVKSYHVMKNWRVNDEKDLDDKLGLLSRYRDVMEKYHVGGPEELDKCLDQRQRMNHTLHVLKKDIEQFNQP